MLSPLELLSKVAIGGDAGWALSFHREEAGAVVEEPVLVVGRDQYSASIEAALPGGFGPGKYSFVVEGLLEDDYRAIRRDGSADAPSVCRLYLYWRDANASPGGYLANAAGLGEAFGASSLAGLKGSLVAELAVTRVSRRAGTRRYETRIEAGERAYLRLREARISATLAADTFKAALTRLTERRVTLETYGFAPDGTLPRGTGAHPGNDHVSFDEGTTHARAIRELGKALAQATGKFGRGMLLIRDGRLLAGPRPIPLERVQPHDLAFSNGLLASELVEPVVEPKPEDDPDETRPPPARAQFKLTLRGRPDVKPGDVVRFEPVPEDVPAKAVKGLGGHLLAGAKSVAAGFLGPLADAGGGGKRVALYVDSVEHKLSRTAAFVTTLTGVQLKDAEAFSDAWDATPEPGSAPAERDGKGKSASSAVAAVRAIRSVAEDAAAAARAPEVAEVRSATASGSGEPPGQTETVWRGLEQPDGRGNQARRLAVRRARPSVFEGVAYASPFAWGKCGLVLPRYPGTRVLLVHRNGEPRDPVDVGALWESGSGPETKAGDWWLILPAAVESSKRSSLPASEEAPTAYEGEVTNDLVDADGNRVIEVGELTVRVGTLKKAGTRPERASLEHGVTIEHADGEARITISKDGAITIHAKKDLELVSEDGDILLKAAKGSVDVTVQDELNVH